MYFYVGRYFIRAPSICFRDLAVIVHANQNADLDKTEQLLVQDPLLVNLQSADLVSVLVFKFKMVNQLSLLAYTYEDDVLTLKLLALGSHENFYRDLKQSV